MTLRLGPLVSVSDSVVFWAFRYCLGRRTYAVSDCVDNLVECWGDMSEKNQRLMQQEIRQAIDNESAGMDMDVRQWQRVLELPIGHIEAPKRHSPYIEIVETGTSKTGKTKVWEVRNVSKGTHENDVPGWIRWHGAWRGYVYECEASFYDAKCLRQIADFIETANKDHKEGKA